MAVARNQGVPLFCAQHRDETRLSNKGRVDEVAGDNFTWTHQTQTTSSPSSVRRNELAEHFVRSELRGAKG